MWHVWRASLVEPGLTPRDGSFRYDSIKPHGTLLLKNVHERDDNMSCTLSTFSDSYAPPYNAISYLGKILGVLSPRSKRQGLCNRKLASTRSEITSWTDSQLSLVNCRSLQECRQSHNDPGSTTRTPRFCQSRMNIQPPDSGCGIERRSSHTFSVRPCKVSRSFASS